MNKQYPLSGWKLSKGYSRTLIIASALLLSACSDRIDFHTDTAGEQRWSELEGGYVIVNYFAEWCAPCLRELPELNEFHEEHAGEVTLLGVSFDPLTNAQLAALKEKHQIEFPLVQTEPAPVLPFERPKMLPATYIVKPDGSVEGPLLGEQTIDSLKQATGIN